MEFLKRMVGLEVANGTPQTFVGVGVVVLTISTLIRTVGRFIARPVRS